MPRAYRGRLWCFTLNNYSEDEKTAIDSLVDTGAVSYLCYGIEVGDGGTPHLQGYCELSRKRTLTTTKQLGGLERAHLERRRGSQSAAIDYCRKDGQFVEYGNRQSPGRRRDLERVRQRLDDGHTVLEAIEDDFSLFLQYRRGLEAYRASKVPRRTTPTYTIVLWGPTGTGKTRWVHYLRGDRKLFIYPGTDPGATWFDGYEGDELVLFDDFRGAQTIKFEFLLRLLDRYPMRVPVKGGFVEWAPRKVYITSNLPPDSWYPDVCDRSPLWRRINQCDLVDVPLFDDISSSEDHRRGLRIDY